MSVSKDEVIAAYRAILGRDPENELTVEGHRQNDSLEALLKSFVDSEEFASRMKFVYGRFEPSVASEISAKPGEIGTWEEAARRYRGVVDQNPHNGAAWMKYGHALRGLGQLELAESAYKRAIGVEHDNYQWYIHLGDVLKRLERHAESQSAYVAAYRLNATSRAAAARLRSLPPEVASGAFDRERLFFPQGDDPAPVRTAERQEFMTALGLPFRPPAEDPSVVVKALREPKRLDEVGRALALISTRNFLPFARLTARSFREHHPEFDVFLLLVDGQPEDVQDFAEGRVVALSELDVPHAGLFAAKFTASEFANALKPTFLRYLSNFVQEAVYLDCDIVVFSRLTELVEAMDTRDVVLIPHMLTLLPNPEHYHTHPTRSDIFNSGLVNAGCFGVNLSRTKDFLQFWETALLEPSAFFDEAGYQTDQQYLNWALIRIPNTELVREPRYNVAYWNLHERDLRVSAKGRKRQFKVDGKPLGFFHFSGYDLHDRLKVSKHDGRHLVYNFPAVAEILSWYSDELLAQPDADVLDEPYRYDKLANGFRLSPFVRRILKKYERFAPKMELDSPEGADALCAFLMDPLPATGSLLPLVLAEIYEGRGDLRSHWSGAHVALQPDGLRWWFCRHAGDEYPIQFLIDRFRRSLVSDSAFGFARQISTALGTGRLRFLGEDRVTAAGRLRAAGEPGMAQVLLETRAEWVYFSDMSAAFVLYENRPDLRGLFPDPHGEDLEAFCDWLDACAPEEHGAPAGLGLRLQRCGHGATLARIYSFLARREDIAVHVQDSLLEDDPEPAFRALIRAAGDGLEFDLDDVIVLRHMHQVSRHLIVPLYLELPLVRERPDSSRVAGRNLAVLPESVRNSAWAQRGAAIHAASFDAFEARLEDELRRMSASPSARPRQVADLLRATSRRAPASTGQEPAYRAAVQRLASAGMVPSSFAARLEDCERAPGVNVFGYFASDIGVGESSRGLASAIACLRPVNRVPTWTAQMREGTELASLFQRFDPLTDTNVFVGYPHQAEDVLGRIRPEHLAGRRNVAHLAWEQKDANLWWKVVYDRYDEIWAISDFAATAFRDMFPGRVRVVPNVLDFDAFPTAPEATKDRLLRDTVNFLFVFDANSSMERKNPEGVLEAFERAFKGTSSANKVRLTLKVGGMHRQEHAARVERLMRRAAATGLAIEFDGRQLPKDGLLRMIADADCYVSLHRAEGFGYTTAEAMAYGVPVIASGYSGNLEYMTTGNSFLVPCKEVFVKSADGPFQRGSVWGEPDLDVAAELMRRAVVDRAGFRDVGERGRETVFRTLSASAVAEAVRPFFDGAALASNESAESADRARGRLPETERQRDQPAQVVGAAPGEAFS